MRVETIWLLLIISLSICVGVYNFRISKPENKVLVLILSCTLWAECIAELAAYKYKNNLFVYHFFNPIEYSLFSLMYYWLFDYWTIKKWILFSIIFYFPLSIWNSFFWQPFNANEINSYAIITESILLVFYSLLLFYSILKSKTFKNIYSIPSFWVNVGVLIFFATNVFFWGYYNKMIHDAKDLKVFYKILFFENILLYLLCGITLFLPRIDARRSNKNS